MPPVCTMTLPFSWAQSCGPLLAVEAGQRRDGLEEDAAAGV
jgi:hypothetical protein